MNGIQVKYTELCRVSIEQLYYENRVCRQFKIQPERDIQILPTQNCLEVMNRMNIVFRNTDANGGFILLANVAGTNGGGNDLLRFAAKKEDALSFLMLLKNPDVINFDDLPVQPANDSIYYFSNEVTDVAALRNNLHLSQNAAGVDGANDVIKKSNENYHFHAAFVILPGTAEVKHLVTGQVLEPASLVTQTGVTDLSFSLSAFPLGKCRLLINNLPVEDFYYLEKYATLPVFGIIQLSLSPALPSNYRIIEGDRSLAAAKPFYTITFNNRQTLWRYIIRLQTNSPLYLEMAALSPADKTDFINKLNIVSNDTAITFSRITATDTEFVFVSDSQLFLREKYFSAGITHDALNFKLTKYIGDAREAVVKANLPYAPTSSLDATTLPQIFSDIFLTL
jgi:hypothetical protein